MKRIILALVILLMAVQAQAQFSTSDNLKFGLRAGLNVSTLSNDPNVTDSDAGVGTEFGIFGRIGERIYVQPGLDYVTHKVHAITTMQPRQGERDAIAVRLLRVPVLIGYRTLPGFGVITGKRFMAGPSIGFNVGVADNNLDVRWRNVNTIHYGLNAGAGIDFARIFSLDLMYHHGFNNVLDYNTSAGKFRTLSLGLGVSI